jgi:DNA-directed RNA polymerase subunit RPC12/RpoP
VYREDPLGEWKRHVSSVRLSKTLQEVSMAGATYYVQECPTCGRNLQVRVEYLGKRIACQHCSARFEARDPSSSFYDASDSSLSMLARADELIAAAEKSTIWYSPNAGARPA